MVLEQFKMYPSKRQGVKEESKIIKLDENKTVQLMKLSNGFYKVKKKVNGKTAFNVDFSNDEKLKKCLKNISKK